VQQQLLEELVRERLEENHKRLLLRSERTFQPIQLGGRVPSR
jgi:hypothetical protein